MIESRRSTARCLVQGYRGKNKPNLFLQETHSMTCVFRILFRLFHDRKHANVHELLQRRLLKFVSKNDVAEEEEKVVYFRLMRDSLEYYLSLQSESHRDAWTNLLMLLLTKLLRLNDERVRLRTGTRTTFRPSILFVVPILRSRTLFTPLPNRHLRQQIRAEISLTRVFSSYRSHISYQTRLIDFDTFRISTFSLLYSFTPTHTHTNGD